MVSCREYSAIAGTDQKAYSGIWSNLKACQREKAKFYIGVFGMPMSDDPTFDDSGDVLLANLTVVRCQSAHCTLRNRTKNSVMHGFFSGGMGSRAPQCRSRRCCCCWAWPWRKWCRAVQLCEGVASVYLIPYSRNRVDHRSILCFLYYGALPTLGRR